MSCEYCHIGHYELTFSSYIHWYKGKIMVIPNAPAYSCDICGHMEYDENFLQKLNHLLNRFSEEGRNSSSTYRQPAVYEPAFMQAARKSQ